MHWPIIVSSDIANIIGKSTAVVLSGPQYHYALTEVAIGTGALPLGRVEWGLNSVLNEGATGIHIGVGNGLNGIHFDFISTEARLDGI
ncbi:hypothetical protein [Ralstonia solanacearum]|uniref:hypothetical protein n=1 Tax=Ralstonia solanacearum TaxID=305 RepID=UPI001F152C11|nr:hypothetical protein [Ralstonia solanacearum]